MLSKTKIDQLGDRLRKGEISEDDLRSLDEYRRSFGDTYQEIVGIIRNELNFSPTGRPAKSTGAIIDKLKRESIRLSQIQDIAGCRVVVLDVIEQDKIVTVLKKRFSEAVIVDRRNKPSFGYRAVHVIIKFQGKPVEIQVRSELQHLWAELSEKLSDVIDPDIKYGGGGSKARGFLMRVSDQVAKYEDVEEDIYKFINKYAQSNADRVRELMIVLVAKKDKIKSYLVDAINILEKKKG